MTADRYDPWVAQQYADTGGWFVATLDGETVAKGPLSVYRAHLIGAAPKMLAALERAEVYLRHPDVQAIPFAVPAAMPLGHVRDAIAHAKGQATPC